MTRAACHWSVERQRRLCGLALALSMRRGAPQCERVPSYEVMDNPTRVKGVVENNCRSRAANVGGSFFHAIWKMGVFET